MCILSNSEREHLADNVPSVVVGVEPAVVVDVRLDCSVLVGSRTVELLITSHFLQTVPINLTEEDIFSLPIVNPLAGGDVAAVEYNFQLALRWNDSEISEVFQTLLMNSEIGTDVRVEDGILERMQPVNSYNEQRHVHKYSNPAFVILHNEQMWASNKGLEQKVQEWSRRPQRQEARASSSSTKHRPTRARKKYSLEVQRRQSTARVQRNNSLGPIVEWRSWRDLEMEKAVAMLFTHRKPPLTNAKTSMELTNYWLHYLPSLFPNSRLKHPFQLPMPDITLMSNKYPVLNGSDFAQPAAPVQQVPAPTQETDYMFQRPNSTSEAQVQAFANPTLIAPAPMTLPTVTSMADRYIVAATTRIDPLEVLAVDGLQWPNPISSPLFLVDIPESTFLKLDVQELQAMLADQPYNVITNAHSTAVLSLEQQQQNTGSSLRGTMRQLQMDRLGLETAATKRITYGLGENLEMQQELHVRNHQTVETMKDRERHLHELQGAQLIQMMADHQAQSDLVGLQAITATSGWDTPILPNEPVSPIQVPNHADIVQLFYLLDEDNYMNPYTTTIISQDGNEDSTESIMDESIIDLWI